MQSTQTAEPTSQVVAQDAIIAPPPPPPVGQKQGQGSILDSAAPTTGLDPNSSTLGAQLEEQQRLSINAQRLMDAVQREYDAREQFSNGIDMRYEDRGVGDPVDMYRARPLQWGFVAGTRDNLSADDNPTFSRTPLVGTPADPHTPAVGPVGPTPMLGVGRTASPSDLRDLNSEIAEKDSQIETLRKKNAVNYRRAQDIIARRNPFTIGSSDTPAPARGIGGGGRARRTETGTAIAPERTGRNTRANPGSFELNRVFDAENTDYRSPMRIASELNQSGGSINFY
jgi:hypothetical protein